MKLQTRSFVVRKPETIDITAFFKKFCIATRTTPRKLRLPGFFAAVRLPSTCRNTVQMHDALIFVFLFLVAYAVIAFFPLGRIWFKHIINRYSIGECVTGAFPSVNILSLVDTPVTWIIYTNHFLSSSATLSDSAFASSAASAERLIHLPFAIGKSSLDWLVKGLRS